MNPEARRSSEISSILTTTAIIGSIYLLSNFAFSLEIRKKIGKRDHWQCQDCGARFSDGIMVHASHYNHDSSSPDYDNPDNGRIQCVDCHQGFHEDHVGTASEIGLTEEGNAAAIKLLKNTERRTRANSTH
jgi:hypothetical protein